MSTLTEKIAEAFEGHIFDKPIGRCRCNAPMDPTGHRTREHRTHLAEITAGVVAEWLGTEASSDLVHDAFHDDGHWGCERQDAPLDFTAEKACTTLAAEAVKGAE